MPLSNFVVLRRVRHATTWNLLPSKCPIIIFLGTFPSYWLIFWPDLLSKQTSRRYLKLRRSYVYNHSSKEFHKSPYDAGAKLVTLEEKDTSSCQEVVAYLLRNYAQSFKINSAIADLCSVSHWPLKIERNLATELNQTVCHCIHICLLEEVQTKYVIALHPTICSVVANYRKSHCQTTYQDVVDCDQHEENTVQTTTSTPQSGRDTKPIEKF